MYNLNSFHVISDIFRKHLRPIAKAPKKERKRERRRKRGREREMSVIVRSLWRSKRSVQVQFRSTRSHVRGHYRHNYHVASTPDAFQLRGIDEARRGEASFSPREKPCTAPCMLPIAVDAFTSKGWRGPREARVSFYLHFSMPL